MVEDLHVAGMRSPRLARRIAGVGCRATATNSNTGRLARRRHPGRGRPISQFRNVACGVVQTTNKLSLSERTFTCGGCGTSIDRDLNAARNLAALHFSAASRGLPEPFHISPLFDSEKLLRRKRLRRRGRQRTGPGRSRRYSGWRG
ncbi:transposase [Rhodococcus hoagii]|nr:transposase [Prescottella equi]